MTHLTVQQESLLKNAITLVEAQHPTLRSTNVEVWLDLVVYLCRLKDPAFGRKRNPSGVLSPNTLGVWVVGAPAPAFEAVDIVRDDPSNGNPLRPFPWLRYPPGPSSDSEHVGPDQQWVEQTTSYPAVGWPDDATPSGPADRVNVRRSEFDALVARVAALEAGTGGDPADPDDALVLDLLRRIAEDVHAIRAR